MDSQTVEVPVQLLKDCNELLTVLTKNAAHCFGIDFGKLNETMMALAAATK